MQSVSASHNPPEPTGARVLVIGASGLIGSAVSARLISLRYEVLGLARRRGSVEGVRWIEADLRKLTKPEAWLRHLEGVAAVVNCAGTLQDSPFESTKAVHNESVSALFAACERKGVRRVVHLSAIGVDRATPTAFSKTKLEGDVSLQARDLDWVILRPSVVVGRAAFGGSALFRGLSALPVLPVLPDTGQLQIVQLDDLVQAIAFFLQPDAPSRLSLDVAGPERLNFTDVVLAYRRWLGLKPPRLVRLPKFIAGLIYRFGDVAGWFGWRPPIRSTAQKEIVRGAVGDEQRWTEITGISPSPLEQALQREPASIQEKWFAHLYLLKPLVFTVLVLFWVGTGLISLGPGWDIGMSLLREGGISEFAPALITAGALADILIGIGIAFRRTARMALWGAFGISLVYVTIGTILVPRLWADPLGPMLKIWPVMALNLMALAIVDDR